MDRRPVAAVLTLGCKLNLADSEEIARGLRAAGYDVVDRLCEADAFVVNTCSVTHVADQKSRKLIRSVQRMSPGAAVTVTGCYPQSAGFVAIEDLGADLVVGTRDADKERLVGFLGARASARGGNEQGRGERGAGGYLHSRVFVKAQEGCNDVCAFCIVPRTRGREESRAIEQVVAEVNLAVEAGAKEAVITGTQLGAWGRDFEHPLRPHHLIGGILERTEVPRLRFSSLQPQDITPELLALWDDPRLMPHFHLALQSGSEATLERMRRRYSAREYRMAVERIRAAVPDVAITTDVIAGFPGETEGEFEDTLRLCEEAEFARIHAFPYSQRSRTAAALMKEQVPPTVRQERMRRLLALGEELSLRFRRRFEGGMRAVLWEGERATEGGTVWHGHTDNYIPVFARGIALRNRITRVEIGQVYDDGVWGRFPMGDA
ncbi:MAG TPA: MiaB/RimO family radical SAM methylthiotransferase [Tepidiformaceae bacterium]|nr:MiaB/RimO family radical SAM methylthiotransferase [Tepidiformaceae bacterium]